MSDIKQTFLSLLLILSPVALQADDDSQQYDRINLTASASQEVKNDLLSATLYAQQEGQRPTMLAERVNLSIKEAVEQAKQQAGIKVSTLGYMTTPIYRKQKIDGWRVRQSIRLQSQNATALSQLIGQLQKGLAVQSINYMLSPQAREMVENNLMAEAIAAFQKRAVLIAKQFGRSDYRLVEISINTPGGIQPRMMHKRLEMASMSDMAAPAIEAGSQRITLTVSGTIELNN